jgi:hypothetical protein
LVLFISTSGGSSHDSAKAGSQYGSVLSATEPGSGGGGASGKPGGSHITLYIGEVTCTINH